MYVIDGVWIKMVTYLLGILLCFNVASCNQQGEKEWEIEAWQRKTDSFGNATLDSIYKMQVKECDSLQAIRIPILVDSLVKNDSIKRLFYKKK